LTDEVDDTGDDEFDDAAAATLGALAAFGWRGAGLRSLTIRGRQDVRAAGLAALLRYRWSALEELAVNGAGIAFSGAALAGASFDALARLKRLDLGANAFGVAGVRLLAGTRWERLEELVLEGADANDATLEALAATHMPAVCSLELGRERLAAAGLRSLASAGWRLRRLHLERTELGDEGAAALAAVPLSGLRVLHLDSFDLTAAGLAALAGAPWFAGLEELYLSWARLEVGDTSAAIAAVAQGGVALRALDIQHTEISAAGLASLLRCRWPALEALRVTNISGRVDFADAALAGASFDGLARLAFLDLSGLRLGAAGARLLAGTRWEQLRALGLAGTGLDDAAVAALAPAGPAAWPRLACLNLWANSVLAPPTLEQARRWAPALETLDRPIARERRILEAF
jgi:hypothetical protein